MHVKWDTCISVPFAITKGIIRQEGVLSPYILNLLFPLMNFSVQSGTARAVWTENKLKGTFSQCSTALKRTLLRACYIPMHFYHYAASTHSLVLMPLSCQYATQRHAQQRLTLANVSNRLFVNRPRAKCRQLWCLSLHLKFQLSQACL